VRVFLNYSVDAQAPIDKIEARRRQAAADPLHQYDKSASGCGDHMLPRPAECHGSAYMRKPWGAARSIPFPTPNIGGFCNSPEKLKAIAKLCPENDLRMTGPFGGRRAQYA